ncbi:YhgE/Pip domain-containing protein [Niallia taxi]|uniref:YhgE/Pip domain-containing protein n=1 Tax=Niallia taxi TaxID=2499688 RepID=UPI0015F5430D|nr:ABC transporter permease [Niallia taxi]
MFKNKLLLLTPIIALAIIFIFSLTLIPSVQPEPKNLPIAIVNADEGVELPNQTKMNMGKQLVEMIKENSKATSDQKDPTVKWVEVKNTEELQKGLDNQEYCAALVIPKDLSAKQASLQTAAPSAAEIKIYVNQGMNTMASTLAGQILNGIVDNMNNNVRTQLLQGLEQQGATITAKQAEILAAPITSKVTNVNETGTNSANGNAPVSLFQPLWMASLASAAFIYVALRKMANTANRKRNFAVKLVQILIGAIATLVVGFGLTWIASDLVGLHIPDFTNTALFLSITSFSFFLMISAVLSLIGLRGMPLFILMLFFGAPLLAMAPEMMSPFYHDWVYSWLPMRFMIGGLRELLFFGKGLTWDSVSHLVWIGAGGLIVMLATALRVNATNNNPQNQNLEG